MLIISNGAYKSGSTWVWNIAKRLCPNEAVPPEFQDANWSHPKVATDLFSRFLETVDLAQRTFVYKAHYSHKDGLREVIIANPHVKLLNIYRDPKDAVVSAYFRSVRKDNFQGTAHDFCQQRGEGLVRHLSQYHVYWDPRQAPESILLTTYTGLHEDFEHQVGRIARFLGVPATPEQIATIKHETVFPDPSRRESSTETRHYRKGVIGDWINHLTPEDGAKIDQIESEYPVREILDLVSR